MDRGLLLYDADCGFCQRTAGKVPLLRLELDVTSLQSRDLPALGVDPERALRDMPYVDAAGAVHYGHLAYAHALSTGPLPCRIVGRLLRTWPISVLAGAGYRLISRNRHRLPGGTAACELPPRPVVRKD